MSDEQPLATPSFIVSAAFVALVVVAGAAISLWPNDDGAGPSGTGGTAGEESPSPPSPVEERSFTPSESGSLCGLEAHTTEFELLLPIQDTTWTAINGMRAPESAEFGPGVLDGGVRYCYARTPEGAVLAAANFLVLANFGREEMVGRWDLLVIPGPGRDAFASVMEAQTEPAEVEGQISAARVVSYSEDEARISIAIALASGERASMSFDLEWTQGDWKIVVDDSGENDSSFTVLEDLTGFTPWAAI
ncbi:hypothetical protein ACIBFB_05495 [Nocardiopsis sp. NPDC050513]|uniref:hypothetical protein n=1 Tax=Nocardiopsis sp. NPDC050513 TaxID=3364338 RepID=UPI00379DF177